MARTDGGPSWGAVVLTGGTGRRLGGADKAALEVDGSVFLDRSLAAVGDAAAVVVVGPRLPVTSPVAGSVRFTRERPPGSGPAAALLHGADLLPVPCAVVVVLAVDMPLVVTGTVARLLDSLAERLDHDAALLDDGRPQPLCAAYRRPALRAADPGTAGRAGLPVHRLLDGMRVLSVPASGAESLDVDEPGDLDRVRAAARALHDPGSGGKSPLS